MKTRTFGRRLAALLILATALSLTGGSPALAQDLAVEQDIDVVMSDGAILKADLYRPAGDGRFPTVLVRTPYDKGAFDWLGQALAAYGQYAVLIQDVRGQVSSEGEFEPFADEYRDGIDTLDWIVKQAWCDGSVGMWGSSYLAYCALVLAPSGHPALKTIINISGWGDPVTMAAPGGAMHLMVALPWTLSPQIAGGERPDFEELFGLVPVSRIPELAGIENAEWASYFEEDEEGLGGAPSTAGRYAEIGIPIFHITGWNDFLLEPTLEVYENVREAHASWEDAPFQKLIVGPWHHDQQWSDDAVVGDVDFGPDGALGGEKIVELTIRWFHRFLRGIETGIDHEPAARLFLMGPNEWRQFTAWPPIAVSYREWRLGSGGSANTLSGDGTLGEAPDASGFDSFVFDPMDPVPTYGGANMHFFPERIGVRDQRDIESRKDVLVYTSEPLEADVSIIGPVSAVVFASSEGRSTDFTAKLVAVRPDGYARIVTEGIKRDPDVTEEGDAPMKPGEVYRFTIDMGSTAIVVPAGHRLRVEISSSNFPKYSRNANTGEMSELARELVAVEQKVYHTPESPSHVLLPIVE